MAHSYWRVNITANATGDFPGLSEMQMRSTIGGADLCTGGTVIKSGQYNSSSYAAVNAFDDNYATYWASNATSTGWIGYHFSAPVDIVEYTLSPRDVLSSAPTHWTFDYSDDGVNWTTVHSKIDTTAWTATTEVRAYSVSPNQLDVYSVLAQVEYSLNSLTAASNTAQVEYSSDLLFAANVSAQVESSLDAIFAANTIVQVEYQMEPGTAWIDPDEEIAAALNTEITNPLTYTPPDGGDGKSYTRPRRYYPNWNFWTQEEKYGYINNPNWKEPATDTHLPCGYWPESSYSETFGPPRGRIIALACAHSSPYAYMVCTNGLLHKVNVLTQQFEDYLELPIETIPTGIDLWLDYSQGDYRNQSYAAMALDQMVWLSGSLSSEDARTYLTIRVNGQFEFISIDLVQWKVLIHTITPIAPAGNNEANSANRGGNSHGDYSIWGIDLDTTIVVNNHTGVITEGPATRCVPDFNAGNWMAIVTDVAGDLMNMWTTRPAIQALGPAIGRLYETGDEVNNTFGGMSATWWNWSRALGPVTIKVQSNYHPLWPKVRTMMVGSRYGGVEDSRPTIKFTWNGGGMWYLWFEWDLGIKFWVNNRLIDDILIDDWVNKGATFDSGRYGAVLVLNTPNNNTLQTIYTFSPGATLYSYRPLGIGAPSRKITYKPRTNTPWPFEPTDMSIPAQDPKSWIKK